MDSREVKGDAELILRLKNGEKQVLDALMERYQKPVYFFILRYVHDENLAYDLTQESFFRVYTRISSYNPQYQFSTWLYRIALNLCRDYGRKQAVRKLFFLADDDQKSDEHAIPEQNPGIERRYETDRDIDELHRQIAKLPHKLKSALILYSLEERSQADCSEILGISKKAVETRVYRARKILAEKMNENFEG